MDMTIRTPQQLANILQGVRRHKGLTQAQVAARIGLLQKAISGMEHDPQKSSVERLFKLLAGLNLELVLRDRSASRKTDW